MHEEPNPVIVELLSHAIENPVFDCSNLKSYQRRLDGQSNLTITLYLEGNNGYVSVTAKKNTPIDHSIFRSILVSLAPLSCLGIQGERRQGYIIHRFKFNNPLYKDPLFPSGLDKYLSKIIKPQDHITENSKNYPQKSGELISPLMEYLQISDDPKTPYWHKLSNSQCHICHRELTDPKSLSICIGPICRKRIEKREGQDALMWEEISREELERLWTEHNTYERRRRFKSQD